jgi:hypothetical protein
MSVMAPPRPTHRRQPPMTKPDDRVSSFFLVRHGYDLFLLTNAILGLAWLLQSPARTQHVASYDMLRRWLDPWLPGYYMRWMGAFAIALAMLGHWALSRGRYGVSTAVEFTLSALFAILVVSSVTGAWGDSAASWSSAAIWAVFAYVHLWAALTDRTGCRI